MRSIPGIKSILLCNKGTLASGPVNPSYIGLKEKATLKISDFKTSKDVRGRVFRNKKLASLEFDSKQPTLKMFRSFFDYINSNCDVQMMTEKQSFASGSEDVFKFTAATLSLGLSFEFGFDLEKRYLKGALKGAADYDIMKTLIDSASTATAVTVAGITHPGGEDWSLQRRSKILAIQSPLNTELFDLDERDDVKVSIKSEGDDNGDGQPGVKDTTVHIEVTGNNATVAKVVAQLNKNINEQLIIKIGNNGSNYDALDCAPGALTPVEEIEHGDDKTFLKIAYEGKVRPYEYDFQFGAAYGGVLDDGGLNGGTIKIGY
ncbi:MAG: hypothetical protein HYS25_00890 [Ignavibacteriales bacterium]|nr:hypothetical protein [Ignavibacteriales bacterium]